jgi:hypothetical protein
VIHRSPREHPLDDDSGAGLDVSRQIGEVEVVAIGSVAGSASVAAGAILAVPALYLLVLSVAAFGYRSRRGYADRTPPRSRLVVLVPAHDEAELIGRCVWSLLDQTYPRTLYDVVVIADNCSDDTAAIARAAGAQVRERTQPDLRGKGRALRFGIDFVLASEPVPDAVVVVDADSRVDRDFLTTLVRPFESGADAVQGESLLDDDGTPRAALRAAAFLLVNRVRPAGRAVLGLPATLAGNGMLFSYATLAAHPWGAFTSTEDLEYSLQLSIAGARIAFAGGAVTYSPTAPDGAAADVQQLRWEGGKLHLAGTWVPRLVLLACRQRKLSLLDAALGLAVPPLGLLTAGAAAGTAASSALVATDVVGPPALVPWLVALTAIPVHVLVGLRAAGAQRSAYRALLWAPVLVARKMLTLRRLVTFHPESWVRTTRASERLAEPRSVSSRRRRES